MIYGKGLDTATVKEYVTEFHMRDLSPEQLTAIADAETKRFQAHMKAFQANRENLTPAEAEEVLEEIKVECYKGCAAASVLRQKQKTYKK